jgi:hypothetical protein
MLVETRRLANSLEVIGKTYVSCRRRRRSRRTCTRTDTSKSPLLIADSTSGRVVPVASENITQRRYTGRGSQRDGGEDEHEDRD